MPRKPATPCRRPACPIVSEDPYCAKHEAEYRAKKSVADSNRPSPAERGYDDRWRKIRAVVLGEEPYCRSCSASSTHVDHIKPLNQGGDNSRSNLQALCAFCHSSKTGRNDGGFGNPVRGE